MSQPTSDTADLQQTSVGSNEQQHPAGARKSANNNKPHGRFSWRALASALFIVVATLLVPFAIVAGWAKSELVNEKTFVQTLAPLAQNEPVRAEITDTVSTAIQQKLAIGELVNDAFDGIEALELPAKAKSAINTLRYPALHGAQSIIDAAVTKAVQSEAFAGTWASVLEISHRALLTTVSGSAADGVATISKNGDVVLHLGPVLTHVKEALINDGFALAAQIPEVDSTVTLAHSDALAYVGPAYHAGVTVGWVLPIAVFVLFVLGIVVARSRKFGITGAGIGLALISAATMLVFSAGGAYLTSQAAVLNINPAAIEAIYQQVTGKMVGTAMTLVVLGALLVFLVWITNQKHTKQNSVADRPAGLAESS